MLECPDSNKETACHTEPATGTRPAAAPGGPGTVSTGFRGDTPESAGTTATRREITGPSTTSPARPTNRFHREGA